MPAYSVVDAGVAFVAVAQSSAVGDSCRRLLVDLQQKGTAPRRTGSVALRDHVDRHQGDPVRPAHRGDGHPGSGAPR